MMWTALEYTWMSVHWFFFSVGIVVVVAIVLAVVLDSCLRKGEGGGTWQMKNRN